MSTAPGRLPAGSCDGHFHVFDAARYPYAAGRHYTPADATLEDWLSFGRQIGVDRGVLVHPTVFGSDHRSFEEILGAQPDRIRGVAVVGPDTPEDDIARWHRLGARGTRIVMTFGQLPVREALARIVGKVKPFGWHLQILADLVEHPDMPSRLAAMTAAHNMTVVFDHMGHHAADVLVGSPGLANLRAMLRDGNAWVKLSAPYRLSSDCQTDDAVRQVAQALVDSNPDRLVWGTDWPHPATQNRVPDAAGLLRLANEWLADDALRERVLVRNPGRLYWDER